MRALHPFAILLAFAFALCPAAALDADSLGSASVSVQLSYEISLPAGATSATFSAYAFPNTTAQKATYSSTGTFDSALDSYGNRLATYNFSPDPSAPKRIAVDVAVNVSYDPAFFEFEKVAVGGPDYLSQSSLVKIDDSIASTAQTIAGALDSKMEKTAALAQWVANNIQYDKAYKDFAADSVTVMQSRRGTCDEKSHLLEAMLRSQGIPARHVVGFAYSGEKWDAHAWTEAAIDGSWITIDSTFGEFMFIDAGHLKMAVGRDQDDTRYKITARGISDLSSSSISSRSNISFTRSENFSNFFGLRADYPAGDYGPSQRANISTIAANRLSREIAVPLKLTLNEDFPIVSDPLRIVLLGPMESSTVAWEIMFPPGAKAGYFYNYSADVSAYGKSSRGFLICRAESEPANPFLLLENFIVNSGDSGVTLKFTIRNIGGQAVNSTYGSLSIPVSGYKASRDFGPIPAGAAVMAEFFIPSEKVNKDLPFLNGQITLEYGAGEPAMQQFSIRLASSPANAVRDPNNIEITPEFLVSPQFLLGAAIVIVIILLITKFVRDAA